MSPEQLVQDHCPPTKVNSRICSYQASTSGIMLKDRRLTKTAGLSIAQVNRGYFPNSVATLPPHCRRLELGNRA